MSTEHITAERFRLVLGHLPTGVAVITAHGRRGPVGMAANSLTSVSLDPPLVLFCAAKASVTWPELRAAKRFCVNVMAGHHEEVTRRFSLKGIDRFEGVSYEERPGGPALEGAVAWIECELHEEHDAGDHVIAVAAVTAIDATADIPPLVFFRGGYGTFASGGE